jgi:hypothetical protein
MFSRAAKNFEFANKCNSSYILFCRTAKNFETANKARYFFSRATKPFGIYQQKQPKLSAFCCCTGGNFGICQEMHFARPRSEKLSD